MKPLVYGSVCSGVEAASLAWEGLGWKPSFFSEIEDAPRAVLQHHWPDVPLHGDFTTIKENDYAPIDLLVGGTPCQDFSIAGLRKGIAGHRGNLTLEFLRLVERLHPRWIVWENVPGVLSIDEGKAFGAFGGGRGECGYGIAYRVLDAQYYGVPQRRRRVFVVGHLGDWRPSAAVLFDGESLFGNPAPSRQTGEGFTHDVAPSIKASGVGFERSGNIRGKDPVVAIQAGAAKENPDIGPDGMGCREGGPAYTIEARSEVQMIAHTLRGEGFDASEDGTGRGTPLVTFDRQSSGEYGTSPVASTVSARDYKSASDLISFHPLQNPISNSDGLIHALGCGSTHGQASGAVAFAQNQVGEVRTGNISGTLNTNSNASGRNSPLVKTPVHVRRLTPRECERLQGMPDDHTLVPFNGKMMSDSARYKMIGNSMAVPVMRKIGQRIDLIRKLMGE